MASRSTTKGIFTPKFRDKYTGDYPIIYRSSWELEFMNYCDNHPEVLEWASESAKIPYKNPLTGKQTVYIPDFLVTYMKRGGAKSVKLIEIKPLHEASAQHARTKEDAAIRMRNEAKWGAASQWAQRRGIDFLVLTEAELYNNHANRKGRAHPIKAVANQQTKAPNPSKPTKIKKQTAKNLGKSSRQTRIRAKARLGGKVSTVGKIRKAMKATKR